MGTEPRVVVTFRLSPHRRDWLDTIAGNHHVDRALVVRAALAVAATHDEELQQTVEAMST